MDPLRIWREVFKTDPRHTTEVNEGKRRFTSIKPYYQIMQATKLWGPYGVRWGQRNHTWETVSVGEDKDRVLIVVYRGDLFYPDGDNEGVVSGVPGAEKLFYTTNKGWTKVDDDAWKKAKTDSLTKALSFLGFSGDVFLGMWNDSKYVARRQDEVREEAAARRQAQEAAEGLGGGDDQSADMAAEVQRPRVRPSQRQGAGA